jgi:hypothetical protein
MYVPLICFTLTNEGVPHFISTRLLYIGMDNGNTMSDASDGADTDRRLESSEREELRTIAFRMRELQRLFSIRVEQENRRLEAEGIDPVPTAGFQEQLTADDANEE